MDHSFGQTGLRATGLLAHGAAACAAVLALAPWQLQAAVYQVAVNGADTNDGVAAPWKSLQRGVDALQPGDTLRVLPGEYRLGAAVIVKNKRAAAAAPITIEARGKVVLRDGANKVDPWQGALDVRDSSWIVIRGFSIEQSGFFGIYIDGADHITVERCSMNETLASGVAAWRSADITIRDNDIRAACNSGENARGRGCQEHISLDHVERFLVEGNRVHDSPQSGKAHWGGGEGIDVKNGSSNGIVRHNEIWNLPQVGLYVDAWRADIHNLEIYGNRVHHCANGIALNSEQTGNLFDIRVHDNLSYANGETGLAVWRFKNTTLADVQLYNNTVVGNGLAANKPYFLPAREKIDQGVGIHIQNPKTTALVIRDNISYGNVTAQLLLAAGLVDAVVENNLIGPSLGSGIVGERPVTSDPMFVDAAKSDFRLRPGSPAIDAGIGGSNLGKTDCWGNPRLAGKAVDIGAYEAPADRSRR